MEDILETGGSVKILNTKGCCFLCLRIEDVTRTDVEKLDKVTKYCSMRHLLRHLQINKKFVNKSSDFSAKVEGELIEVNLCKTCREINGKVAKLCQKLEKLKLELNYMLEYIHTRITDSAKDSDRVQNYSRRMTSDFEALSQLAFVDKLRKELVNKCLKMRNGPMPIIQVAKLKTGYRTFIQEEQPSLKDESYVEMNHDPPSPPSPSIPDYADSESSPSFLTPEGIKFNMNLPPKVLEQTPPPPLPFSSFAKHTLDARPSSGTQSTPKNSLSKKKQTKPKGRPLAQHMFCSKDDTTGMFHCKKCTRSYKSCSGIRSHYLYVHLNSKQKEKCIFCEKRVYPSNIQRHERTCWKNPEHLAKQNDAKFRFICNHCGKKFDTRKKQISHEIHAHRNANRYPCHLCEKRFNQQIALKRHVDAVHLLKRVSCRFCNKSYTRSYQTRIHEKKCKKEKKVKVEPEVN